VPRNRRRRITTIVTAVAAVTLTAALATACTPDDIDNSLDCVSGADTIADSLKAIHEAGVDAAKDPTRTDDSIDTIEKNLTNINDENVTTDDGKVDKAVDKAIDDLNDAIKDYNKAILNGDTDPDSSRIDAAADKLTKVCTS
jgi:pyruvate-formate lyase